ncbi:MAG: urease accessory protein UreD [Actinomycetota bacterium]|nr:urease accessory protein UreD [Actinomycetota bacterium]
MRARSHVRAERDPRSGATRLVDLHSETPLLLRAALGGLHLVGGAAGPVRGDELALSVVVGPGATLVVRSVAASLLHPGPGDPWSALAVDVTLGRGATLDWAPEPTIALAGCAHRTVTTIAAAAGARLRWREDVVLGRHDEQPGDVSLRLDVTRCDAPLLRQELCVGPSMPAWDGPGGLAGARRIRSTLEIGWESSAPPVPDLRDRRLDLADDAWLDVSIR